MQRDGEPKTQAYKAYGDQFGQDEDKDRWQDQRRQVDFIYDAWARGCTWTQKGNSISTDNIQLFFICVWKVGK